MQLPRAWMRAAAAIATALAVVFVAWLALVFATVPDLDKYRSVEWTRLPDGTTNATAMDASPLPPPLLADMMKANATDRGSTTLAKADADRFWSQADAAIGRERYQVGGHHGYVISVNGRVFDVSYGPIP